jgi:hypothetical protein
VIDQIGIALTGVTAMSRSHKLYAVHILGPDDIFAAPSKEAAERAAKSVNDWFSTNRWPDVEVKAVVIEWPFSEELHASDVGEFDENFVVPVVVI